MSFLVVGLSHRTVPIDLLERVAIPRARLPKALADVAGRDFIAEAVILSTCHRTEVYVVAEKFHGAVQDVRRFFSEYAFTPIEDIADHVYTYHDDGAIEHLFEVAAGIDSVLIGESQILGQVRDAWDTAREEGAAGRALASLFRHALEVGKRARSETGIARGITSLSQASLAMARQRLGSLDGRRVLIVGTGEVGEGMVADLSVASEAADVVVASRTRSRAERLADRVGGRAVELTALGDAVVDADLVLASTGATSAVLRKADLAGRLPARDGRPLLLVDLGMPRNVDPEVGTLPGVTLLDLDDLRAFVDAGLDQRRREVSGVRAIVAEEAERFAREATAREVSPTITALRQQADDVRIAELDRLRARLTTLDAEQRATVDSLTRSLVAKLLHEPTVRLKAAAGTSRGERLAEAVRDLFLLESLDGDPDPSTPSRSSSQPAPLPDPPPGG